MVLINFKNIFICKILFLIILHASIIILKKIIIKKEVKTIEK